MSIFKYRNFKKQKQIIQKRYPICSADLRCGCEKGLISVILPVYNCEKYLSQSIKSVLSQTYRKLELIIVDDGSTDSSGAIAESFANDDSRVRVIRQSNLKLPSALNTGFKEAKGEFLTWTSADNIMLPSCLEILSAELFRNRRTDMVFGNMQLIDENSNILRGYGWYEIPPLSGNVILPDETSKLNTHPNNTIGAAFLYRKSAAITIGEYSDNLYTLEDYDFFMRMNFTFSIKHTITHRPIYQYRIHKDSLTSHDKELKITESRPALMNLDIKRREGYLSPLFCYIDGKNKDIEKDLSFLRIYSKNTAERLISKNQNCMVYINIENVPPTIEIPKNSFLICKDSKKSVYGYNNLICLNESSAQNGWVYPVDNKTIFSFIFHKTKNFFVNQN